MDIRGTTNRGGAGGGISSEEEMEDHLKCIAKENFDADKNSPISVSKEPTQEHLLLREAMENAIMWEKAMDAKYTEGQAGEILDRVSQYMCKSEFPNELFHNWTEDLMNDAKNGWRKFKALQELFDKYPQQNMEQKYCEDTGDWIMLDVKKVTK